MTDLREAILVRLLEVAQSVPGVEAAGRNLAGISEGRRPAIVIFDGDEGVEGSEVGGRRRPDSAAIVVMTPEVYVLASKRAEDIGAALNVLRRRVIRRVLTDVPLRALVGPNGDLRYAGCGTALAAGRSMEGEMSLSFAFQYVLKPLDLED